MLCHATVYSTILRSWLRFILKRTLALIFLFYNISVLLNWLALSAAVIELCHADVSTVFLVLSIPTFFRPVFHHHVGFHFFFNNERPNRREDTHVLEPSSSMSNLNFHRFPSAMFNHILFTFSKNQKQKLFNSSALILVGVVQLLSSCCFSRYSKCQTTVLTTTIVQP